MNALKFYIGGEWVDPSHAETIEVINPATEEVIETISAGSAEDVDRAVSAARAAFDGFSRTSREERIELLTKVRETYKKRFEDIAEAIRLEMGAPLHLARGGQTAVGLGHLATAIRVLQDFEYEEEKEGFLIRYEPIGVCGLITPWNWPMNQIVAKLAPALASGCTCVLKPSELAPLSAHIMAEIMDEAGVPAGVFNLVNGYGPVVGEAMSAHPDIDMMSFTGSTRGGVAVAKGSADTVKRVSQELGGKSANIILDDEKFQQSVSIGVQKIMENTGQSCNAPTRMIVPKTRQDEALEIAKNVTEKLITGDPTQEETDIGPLVSQNQFDKVQRLIDSGIKAGAQLVTGGLGKPMGVNAGYFVKPTVFGSVESSMEIAQEEIFGPVLSVISYEDIDHAIRIANDTSYGLSAYVCGGDVDKLRDVARKIRAGQIHINYGSGGTNAPFGGFKQSGNGREKAEWGLEEFLETKAIMG